jgi:hypothetical protein
MRKLWSVLIIFALCCSVASARSSHGGSHRGSHHSSKESKSVHVREYTRKDGTVVHAHDRALPGEGVAYRHNRVAEGYELHPSVERDSHGRIKRSAAAKDAFKRQSPCPATGKSTGRCPGYVVDHVKPLECGGADDPSNMEWQTTAEGKAKDKIERFCRN